MCSLVQKIFRMVPNSGALLGIFVITLVPMYQGGYGMHVQVSLAEWREHPLLMLRVRGSNPAPSENTTCLPRSQVALWIRRKAMTKIGGVPGG